MTSKREVVVLFLTLAVVGGACYLYFARVFDRSSEVKTAKSLIGAPESIIEPKMGKATSIHERDEFNARERSAIEASFVPRPVPMATGRVYVYNLMPTIILVYAEDGRVARVYVGGT
jgi:hypothetical protein